MNKFNEVAQTVLKEEIDPKIVSHYRQKISDILSKKGLRAFEQNEVMDLVQSAIKLSFNEGYKAAEKIPFK